MNSKIIFLAILTVIVSVTGTSAFADHSEVTIETADNDLAAPGCLETEIGCYTPNTAVVDVGGIVTMTNTDECWNSYIHSRYCRWFYPYSK